MNIERISICEENSSLLTVFLELAGSSLQQFRYFAKRPIAAWKNHLCTYLFLQNGKPVCYGHLDRSGDKIWLGIAVIESESGKGYGKKMMEELLESARKRNLKGISLTVDIVNLRAKKLYESFGFKPVSDRETYQEYYLDLQ